MAEPRNLILYTQWISDSTNAADYYNTTISNSVGSISNNRSTNTWNNINLRQLMGDTYYNTYSKFTITVGDSVQNVLNTSYLANTYRRTNDYFFDVYLSGLQFDPSINEALITTGMNLSPPTVAGQTIGYGSGFNKNHTGPTYVFNKPQQDNVNMTVNRKITSTQQFCIPLSSDEILGHSMYTFEIKGIL
jgi:hypothetical protein